MKYVTVTPKNPMSKDVAMLLESLINQELRKNGPLRREIECVIKREMEIEEHTIQWQPIPPPGTAGTFERAFDADAERRPVSPKVQEFLKQRDKEHPFPRYGKGYR